MPAVNPWSVVPQWLSLFSIVVAIFVYWKTQNDKVRAQAAKVAAWTSYRSGADKWITVSNFSTSPAFDVEVMCDGLR